MDSGKEYLKWGIVAAAVMAASVFLLPVLVTVVWNAVSIVVGLAALGAAWIFLPVLAEFAANSAWWLKEQVWRSNPVSKLWRDLHAFGKEIEELEVNIAAVATEESNAKSELQKQRQFLDPDEVLDWHNNIEGISEAKFYLMEQRDGLRVDYKDMERLVRKSEAHWKMGKALNRAADAVNSAGKIAAGTDGGRVSMDEIQTRLAQGRAKLEVIRSRKSVKDIKSLKAIEVNATVMPARVSLTNNPSEVLPIKARAIPASAPVSVSTPDWDPRFNKL